MRVKEFGKAIEALKAFEKRDQHLKAMAATNLSFIYFLEGDIRSADKYADLAYEHDLYNARALVNKGNCLAVRGDYDTAKQFYLEAIGVEADCVEAIYDLGEPENSEFENGASRDLGTGPRDTIDRMERAFEEACIRSCPTTRRSFIRSPRYMKPRGRSTWL